MRTLPPFTRTLAMALTAGALAILPGRQAAAQQTFWFSFTQAGVNASGQLVANPNGDGTFTAVSSKGFTGIITGAVENGAFALTPNGSAPACANSNSVGEGADYIYDNQLLVNQSPVLSGCGLLFQFTNGDFVHIFADTPGYLLSEDPNGLGDYAYYGNGTFTLTTTPEPSSMALLGTGLIGLVPVVRPRRR